MPLLLSLCRRARARSHNTGKEYLCHERVLQERCAGTHSVSCAASRDDKWSLSVGDTHMLCCLLCVSVVCGRDRESVVGSIDHLFFPT